MPKILRSLARDREDWRAGRDVTGFIEAIEHGTHRINFGRMTFSHHGDHTVLAPSNGVFAPKSEYIFVAGITERCSEYYQSQQHEDENCFYTQSLWGLFVKPSLKILCFYDF